MSTLDLPKKSGDSLPNSMNLGFLEELYQDYLNDPSSVSSDWRRYFQELTGPTRPALAPKLAPSFKFGSIFNPTSVQTQQADPRLRDWEMVVKQDRVDQMIRAYRVRGHMIANLDPLSLPRPSQRELEFEHYGFTESDLDRPFSTATIQGPNVQSLRRILERMRNTYCRSIGVQFMHMDDLNVRHWLQERMEGTENRLIINRETQIRILRRLTNATLFEEFIQKRFQGAKSFSLEGAETLIPLLDLMIEASGGHGVSEIVLGMAHRGRLNVLANIMGKGRAEIFREFADIDPKLHLGRGDVKYHLGYSGNWNTTTGKTVHLTLCFNPSHLEFVNPVALGRIRAKQDRQQDTQRTRNLTILIHGDAAFAGEGIVQETFNLSQLEGYRTGGTIHVVVNNQIGFVTSPSEGRSTVYATDVAKMLQIPIFHVNGEDPEAVAQVVQLAADFQHQFHRDVVIDMYCYRRRGHNENDEPAFTHPLMYRAIDHRRPVRERYQASLLEMGEISENDAQQIVTELREQMESELSAARSDGYIPRSDDLGGIWKGYFGGRENDVPDVPTGLDRQKLSDLMLGQSRVPDGFTPHPKIERLLKDRGEMALGNKPLDWSAAESLAFASLVTSGHRVRLSGQDSTRGTFSQRHAVLHDYETGQRHTPLCHLDAQQATFEVINSPLSEMAVLGFDYGYSLDYPEALVLWEAQFGDFANVAQVIIDQFIASAESKWRRLSGLTLLLPHGFEGQGPEHSSARPERFLSLAADHNMQVVNLSTPAQYFHCLRRQVIRKWRKPLIIMTPKSMLRNPKAVSTLDELATGTFQRVIPDDNPARQNVSGVLLCSGKLYWELLKEREDLGRQDVAIVRMEQIYPLPSQELRAALSAYPDGTPVYWVQEEPDNMGAWRFLLVRYGTELFDRLPFSGIYRRCSSSPATGSHSAHKLEQKELLMQAFACI